MKKLGIMLLIVFLAASVFAGGKQEESKDAAVEYKIAWYASAVHPYFDAVQAGVKKFELGQANNAAEAALKELTLE